MSVETQLLPPRYKGPQRIGRGAMGEIFRATDTTLGRAVAIKVLSQRYAGNDDIRERFTREALAAARLSGAPSIVTIFDVGEWHERPFIVMEYLSGGSLDDRLRKEGPQSTGQVLRWLDEAARALDAAHAEGVVHRDVKPANLLLDREGHVHVADFGIASAAGMDSMTLTGTVLGTVGYLSPEQAKGERATPASDRYALAVVAFELLTGVRPFKADSTAAEAAAHVNHPVPSVCERRDELPCELDPVFARALAKSPADRYGSCRELVAELRAALDEAAGKTRIVVPPPPTAPTLAAPSPPAPPPAYRHPGPPRGRPRRRWRAPLVALLALAGLGGGIAGAVIAGGAGGGDATTAAAQTVVKTVTQKGTTVQRTTTLRAPAPPKETTTAGTTAAASGDPHSLNDRGYSLMQQGDYESALPVLQQAVQGLQSTSSSDPYVGYANYNLGYTLLQLDRCSEAVAYLERAAEVEPDRHEPRDALKRARKC